MTVGELNRALQPLFLVAEQALKAREALKEAQAAEEGLTTIRHRLEQARLEAQKAEGETRAQEDRLADEKKRVEREVARFREEQLTEVSRRREELRQEIVTLAQEAAAHRARVTRATEDAGLAERRNQERLEEMGRAVAAAEATHERRAAEQRAEIEALTREVAARRQSLQEVNEQIAALSRR